MTEDEERVLVDVVEGLTVEMQEIILRLRAQTGTEWADQGLRKLADMNVRLCAAFPELLT